MGERDAKQLKELYLPTDKEFVLVDVPEMQFAMIDGEGDPDSGAGARAVRWLFAAIYPMKRIAKEKMGKHFVEPPLEGLFWADDMQDLVDGNRDRLKWRMMIVTPDWATEELLTEGASAAAPRLGPIPESLRLENLHEGKSAQIMHIGPYREEAAALAARLHHEYLPANDLTAHGHHHEIYLTDPNRVAPDKQRTVMRQPVK